MATRGQLEDAHLEDDGGVPLSPWHPIQGPSDASTMWYSLLRKQVKGIFIGTMCIRHVGREALLTRQGWSVVEVESIGVDAPGDGGRVQAM